MQLIKDDIRVFRFIRQSGCFYKAHVYYLTWIFWLQIYVQTSASAASGAEGGNDKKNEMKKLYQVYKKGSEVITRKLEMIKRNTGPTS